MIGDLNPAERALRWRFAVIGALILWHLAVVFAAPFFFDPAGLIPIYDSRLGDNLELVPGSWVIGSSALLGFFVVFGIGRWYIRAILGALGLLWLGMAIVLAQLLTPNWQYDMPEWLCNSGLMGLASVAVFAFFRRFLGWRLTIHGTFPPSQSSQPFQFRLLHLLIAVTLIAATMAVARFLKQHDAHLAMFAQVLHSWFWKEWLQASLVVNWLPAILALGTILLMLRPERLFWWAVILISLLVLLDGVVQFLWHVRLVWYGWPYTVERLILTVNRQIVVDVALLFSVGISAGVLRGLGYRLQPAPKPSSAAPSVPHRHSM